MLKKQTIRNNVNRVRTIKTKKCDKHPSIRRIHSLRD